MTDIRCHPGWHKRLKNQVEDSQKIECARCGRHIDSGGACGFGSLPGDIDSDCRRFRVS